MFVTLGWTKENKEAERKLKTMDSQEVKMDVVHTLTHKRAQ